MQITVRHLRILCFIQVRIINYCFRCSTLNLDLDRDLDCDLDWNCDCDWDLDRNLDWSLDWLAVSAG